MGYQKIKMWSIVGIAECLREKAKVLLEVSNTDAGLPIVWVQPDGMDILIADRIVCSKVSWKQLEEVGYAQGRCVSIDGMPFFCRLPRVGEEQERPNEWDECLDAAGDSSDDLWHWQNRFFWGQEAPTVENSANRGVRGYVSARYWHNYHTGYCDRTVGFRPVLEPIPKHKMPVGQAGEFEGQRFVLSQDAGVLMFVPTYGGQFDGSVLSGIPLGQQVYMGTMLLDGKPIRQDIPLHLDEFGGRLELTDQFFGQEYLAPWKVIQGCAFYDMTSLGNLCRHVMLDEKCRI